MTRYTADVVVIGGGLAGIATALELAVHGKRSLILERAGAERFGGLAPWSFGGMFFVGSPEQRISGIRDSVDLALRDWLAYGEFPAGESWARRWAEAYVSGCLAEVRGWAHAHGVRFFPAVNWTERGYFVPGNSVPRFHLVWGTGRGLVDPLVRKLREQESAGKVAIQFHHHVTELTTEAGAVVGCAGVDGTGTAFEARGECVVLSAGGIAGDLAKVREHWSPELGEPPEILLNGSIPEADGKLIDAAAALGANVTDLSRMWNYAAGVRHFRPKHDLHGLSLVPMKSALWVDHQGRRYVDPPLVGAYDTLHLMERVCRRAPKHSWNVLNFRIAKREFAVSGAEFNQTIRDKRLVAFLGKLLFGNAELVREFVDCCPDFVTARTIPELAGKMNDLHGTGDVDARLLAEEVARYDENVRRKPSLQNDDQLRRIAHVRQYRGDRLRTCASAPIVDDGSMPLIAIRLLIVTRKSLGGLEVDLQGRVLRPDGTVLPGLYAAGEACGFGGGGLHGKRALEGTFLGGCIFSGRTAARAIATGKGADGR